MRIRTVLSAAVLAAFATLPLAGVASAQLPTPTDRDCRDFASQAAAQSALRSHSGDPQRLDPDRNGVACEEYFRLAGPVRPGPTAVRPVIDQAPPTSTVVPPADPAADEPAPAAVPPTGPAAGAPVPVAVPLADDSADAPVRTVPEHQILVKPQGAADTGDGSALRFDGVPMTLVAEALGAVLALGTGWRLVRRSR
jgi:Excalibur calcium-binding domain